MSAVQRDVIVSAVGPRDGLQARARTMPTGIDMGQLIAARGKRLDGLPKGFVAAAGRAA